jgi:hypothetical protein
LFSRGQISGQKLGSRNISYNEYVYLAFCDGDGKWKINIKMEEKWYYKIEAFSYS